MDAGLFVGEHNDLREEVQPVISNKEVRLPLYLEPKIQNPQFIMHIVKLDVCLTIESLVIAFTHVLGVCLLLDIILFISCHSFKCVSSLLCDGLIKLMTQLKQELLNFNEPIKHIREDFLLFRVVVVVNLGKRSAQSKKERTKQVLNHC